MKKSIYPFFSYLRYWFLQEDHYSLQSPFIYRIYTDLISNFLEKKAADLDLEEIRKFLLRDKEILKISDHGAGSKKLESQFRKTAKVTKYSTTGRKFSQLYQYFCSLTPAEKVLELGTCVGINTRYLSRVTAGTLYTFEGSEALYQKAQAFSIEENTQYILGDIRNSLPIILSKIEKVDFILIDATHNYTGTTTYFNQILPFLHQSSIVAIADIHWSKEMDLAWNEIKKHPKVRLSLDFYECGVLFFDEKITSGEYILKI
ncbi:putative O-methyltransferase [Belliella baltica DSM 15883]|uniref:Putative O-methyltransferase n=1 Tax=Belliella baltica (strain DSM 15883 / CIP 108006 / LMG 21964 / BA134) TaxID=866536 RepID=I3Z8U4_BELBD|nr:class I SAM-dependent methyltransferase [Belliella baltica]AFL85662.1 putative O-methyltransferase [Belliella baltica DSM 15883]